MIQLEKYRDKWLAEKVDDFIGFYTREFYCLDNFSAFRIEIDGETFMTVEHAYQAYKFHGVAPDIEQKIKNCASPYEAKTIADQNLDKKRKDWENVNLDYMEKLLRAKLEQHPHVRKKLLETKDYLICEDSPKDAFWGIGKNRDGKNLMGKLWMKLREELKQGKI